MAKKNETPVTPPVISSLPIPSSDSPLVIDLPDGQKLVVGKMATGTVIEVATWRGTGRPDSRTSRLMLGMSSNDASAPQQSSQQDSSESTKKIKTPNNKYLAIALNSINPIFQAIKKFMAGGPKKGSSEKPENSHISTGKTKSKFNISIKKPKSPLANISTKKSEGLEDKEFQDWLDSISKKNEKLSSFKSLEISAHKEIEKASKELDLVFGEGKIVNKKAAPKRAVAKKSAKKVASKTRRAR